MIYYDPKEFVDDIADEDTIKKLLGKNLSLKKSALRFTSKFDFLSKGSITRVAMKTIKGYKARAKEASDDDIKKMILNDPKQLIQRVQNEIVYQVRGEIKDKYEGEFYIWLPSDASEPDPLHQLNYGKRFQVGVGEMPGDRYGCRCGIQLLVEDSSLDI